MEQYRFRVTEDMNDVMKEEGVRMLVSSRPDSEAMITMFRIKDGPVVPAFLIVTGEHTDFALRIYKVISDIPDEKYSRMLEAVNRLNAVSDYLCYSLAEDDSIQIEYDFPKLRSSREASRLVLHIYKHVSEVIDSHYSFLWTALNTDIPLEEAEEQISKKRSRAAEKFREA